MLFCLCWFHATVVYSSLGLITMLYALSLTLGVAGWRIRFRRPSVLAWVMWWCVCVLTMTAWSLLRCLDKGVIQLGRLVGL